MNITYHPAQHQLARLLPGEQPRLLRLCTYLIGDEHAAADIVQETFIEAWRQADKVYDWSGVGLWLTAIARNMCGRWARQQGRELNRYQPLVEENETYVSGKPLVADVDLEIELEQHELVELLDRALALLPLETRDILLNRYVAEMSYTDMAERLGISEALVAVRLHRGKLALRRLFNTELQPEAAVYGLTQPANLWQETRIWCPFCGQQKLHYWLDPAHGVASFRCPSCSSGHYMPICNTNQPDVIAGVKNPKAVLTRQLTWLDQHYRRALAQRTAHCPVCDHEASVKIHQGELTPIPFYNKSGVQIHCAHCGWSDSTPVQYLALDLPETQQFWRSYPRMQLLPPQIVEHDGQPATLITFASLSHAARLNVVSAVDTLSVLSIHH